MVVDDEEYCLDAMKNILENLGINTSKQVDFCINGQEALDQVKSASQLGLRYKIIFTDFSMPVMDGLKGC